MSHIMIDLETLGKKPGSVITQIGLCAFNREGVVDQRQIYVSSKDGQRYGLKIDADTVAWWLKQSDAARKHFEIEGERVLTSLGGVILFFQKHLDKDGKVWGNGAVFDNAILSAMFDAADTKVPWDFWQDACYRTVKGLVPSIPADQYGTAHVAVDDAVKQAMHLIKIAQATGLPL